MMKHVCYCYALLLKVLLTSTAFFKKIAGKINDPDKPNLLVIMTDEHNVRTLGCYRERMSKDQAFVWGENVKVDTPNIDSLAHEGALFENFYATAPVCTPSRGSFLSGVSTRSLFSLIT